MGIFVITEWTSKLFDVINVSQAQEKRFLDEVEKKVSNWLSLQSGQMDPFEVKCLEGPATAFGIQRKRPTQWELAGSFRGNQQKAQFQNDLVGSGYLAELYNDHFSMGFDFHSREKSYLKKLAREAGTRRQLRSKPRGIYHQTLPYLNQIFGRPMRQATTCHPSSPLP